ncbi:cytochrome P450 [Pilatotrama ljubarskyi]|nr:cytochrome P450 [Pilatotrama ljubarskyi]
MSEPSLNASLLQETSEVLESLGGRIPRLSFPITGVALLLALYYLQQYVTWNARSQGRPLPPGPWNAPIIGNVARMTKPNLWVAHRELCETYGDIVYIKVLGMRMVILGSPRAIFGMMEKRSAITSDRQQFPLTPLDPPPPPILVPSRLQYSKVIYGINVTESDDQRIALFETVLESFDAFTPGRFAVSFFPFLAYLPEWMPGAGFQKILAHWRSAAHRAKDEYFAETMDALKQGCAPVCVVSDLMERFTENASGVPPEQMEIVKNVGLTAFEGGSDTTFSTLQSFFLAMSLYPDVQQRAQEELDAVVGPDRLPDHGDKDALPYVNAIIKESLRWQNVLPLALPHVTTEDQEYEGYFIPSGTILVANTWACLHDPEVYPEPERFNPDRFIRGGKLARDVPDPGAFAFGYGRRICPGRHFAEASLFINIAMVLHVFNIEPPLDDNGRPIAVEPRMSDGIMSYPEDCRCSIRPRSQDRAALVMMSS